MEGQGDVALHIVVKISKKDFRVRVRASVILNVSDYLPVLGV